MKVLVTGAAGFIGSHLVDRLVAENIDVVGVDNFINGSCENINKRCAFVEGDIADMQACDDVTTGIDAILHQAAVGSVPLSIERPLRSYVNNVQGTHNILIAAMKNNVKKILIAGSASYYGNTVDELVKTEELPANPENPYAVSKVVCDLYAGVYNKLYGQPEIAVLRYFNVFGPRQRMDSEYSAVIPKFIRAILNGETPVIYGDGLQTRDFTYVDNVVHANMLALTAPSGKIGGKSYNICNGHKYSLNELIRTIDGVLGTHTTPSYVSARDGDIRHSFGAYDRANRIFGYNPIVTFSDGVRRTIDAARA